MNRKWRNLHDTKCRDIHSNLKKLYDRSKYSDAARGRLDPALAYLNRSQGSFEGGNWLLQVAG
jgi:hypothetical protein